jgi:16S rRNA (adenine1518-N6/adenine1519-N6)-dimethyltransferase
MTDRPDPRAVLRAAGLSPKKSFGQNFLVATDVSRKIAETAVRDGERATVIEIGAGTGALTVELAARATRLVAIERDRDLVPLLREAFAASPNVEIVEADAKTADYVAIAGDAPFVLVGNLPYQVTGPLIEIATNLAPRLVRAVFMVQREVAERLAADPGTKEYGALTVFVRAAFDVTRVMRVPPGAFFPPPDVTSAVVAFVPRAERIEETPRFRALVHGAFEKRRKTLRNAWRGLAPDDRIAAAAERASISLDARGETLSASQFDAMARALG